MNQSKLVFATGAAILLKCLVTAQAQGDQVAQAEADARSKAKAAQEATASIGTADRALIQATEEARQKQAEARKASETARLIDFSAETAKSEAAQARANENETRRDAAALKVMLVRANDLKTHGEPISDRTIRQMDKNTSLAEAEVVAAARQADELARAAKGSGEIDHRVRDVAIAAWNEEGKAGAAVRSALSARQEAIATAQTKQSEAEEAAITARHVALEARNQRGRKPQFEVAAMVAAPKSRDQRLAEILDSYKADRITPHEYQTERAKILAEIAQ